MFYKKEKGFATNLKIKLFFTVLNYTLYVAKSIIMLVNGINHTPLLSASQQL